MRSEAFHCDGCGTQKKKTNHWVLISTEDFNGPSLLALAWNDGEATLPGNKHYCGQACASKAFSEWLGTQLRNEATL